jgi:transcriptional regulator with XRE-family HTH domain
VGLHGSNPVLQGERTHAKAYEVERLRRGRYCRQLRAATGISLETMANRTFRDKSTLSRFENGKTTLADVGALLTQYEELGDPVAATPQRSNNSTDGRIAALWVSLGLIALVSGLVPDDTGVDVIRVGAIAAAVVTIVLVIRALRHRVISPSLGAAALLALGGPAIVVAVRLGDPAQGVRGGDGIVLLLASACAMIWLKQDVEGRIRVKRADAKIAAADASAKAA